MKRSLLSYFAAFAVMSVLGPMAKADAQVENFTKALRAVPAPEIPEQAATLVMQSADGERESAGLAVLAAALELTPGTAPEVVGAMARKAPALAPALAASACEKQPKMTLYIAKAAAASAPAYAGQIVGAVAKKQPALGLKVALELARAFPKAGDSIIKGLVEAVPNLRPFVQKGTVMAASSSIDSAFQVLSYSSAVLEKTASSQGVSPVGLMTRAESPATPVAAVPDSTTSTVPDVPILDPGINSPPTPPGHRHHPYSKP